MRASIDRRENLFLRWIVSGGLAVIAILGSVVWLRVANQVDRNTADITSHAMKLQQLESDSANDRRAMSDKLQAITAWLQAIGQRLDVRQPPPSAGTAQ